MGTEVFTTRAPSLRKTGLTLGLACMLFLVLSGSAHASTVVTISVTVTVAGGELQVTASGSVGFPLVTLKGADADAQATSVPNFTLTDARGTGEGWDVTLQSSNLVDGSKVIPASDIVFNPAGGGITMVAGQQVDPTNGPREMNSGATPLDAPKKIITTMQGFGKGRYMYEPSSASFAIHTTANTLAGNYAGTVTATVASGP